MADRLVLSNDTVGGGVHLDDVTYFFTPVANAASAIANSSNTLLPMFMARQNGRVVDFFFGLTQGAVSASGFMSGTANANLRINSVSCLSTIPLFTMQAASAANNRVMTNNSNASMPSTSAVVNAASANFSAGDNIQCDWGLFSAASAAAGQANTGMIIGVTVRYAAI